MTVRELLDAFDRLEAPSKRDFLWELLRRTKELDQPPLDDETIDRIANESFLEYDIREAADAQRKTGSAYDEFNQHEYYCS